MLLFLTACASTNNQPTENTTELSSSAQSSEEIQRYKDAISLLNTQKLDEAKIIFKEFIDNRPELSGPYLNMGLIALKEDQKDTAKIYISKALEKNPRLAQAYNLLGYIEQDSGQILEAKKHYIKAIEFKNDYAIAHYNLALLYDVYLQDINNAIIHYEQYLKLTNNEDQKTVEWLEHLKSGNERG